MDTAHCAVGQCWGTVGWPSQCLCTSDADCVNSARPTTYCKLGSWGVTPESGFCLPKQGAGGACEGSNQCADGLTCAAGVCVAANTRNNWETCTVTAECRSGQQCFAGRCRCIGHDQCQAQMGTDSFCDTTPGWLPSNNFGMCHAPRGASNANQGCHDGGWCQSGLCAETPDPFKGPVCYTHLNLPHDAACEVHEQCGNHTDGRKLWCVWWPFGPAGRGAGYYCGF